jgi:uncharacterized protein (TIGR02271 family)
LGKTHVVPARGVEIHDDYLRVPYEAQRVKDAPSYPAEEVLSEAQEQEIYQYYGVAASSGATALGAETTGTRAGERDVIEERRDRTGVARPPRETATGEVEIPTEEERLRVEKREVGGERVRLRKVVKTEQVNVPVELRKEDVVIERVPADQVRSAERSEFADKEVELEVRREEPVVEKERVVTGAVRARKTEGVEQQTVRDSVRKTDVEVDRSGLGETARPSDAAAGLSGTEAERERERERERDERNP